MMISAIVGDDVVEKKRKLGITWDGLIKAGLRHIEGTKELNLRAIEVEDELKHQQGNISKMQGYISLLHDKIQKLEEASK
jgi:hypothetical protein